MNAYLVMTPKNPEYAGKTFGLKFYGGKAVLSDEMLDPRLGYSVDQIRAALERDYPGYVLKPLSNRAQVALQAALDAEEAEENAGKGEQSKEKAASKTQKG